MGSRKLLALLFALLALASAGASWAHGPRVRWGVQVGGPVWGPAWGPVWGPGWYPPPYYYPPQVVVVPPPTPPVYIEQAEPAAQSFWYYCPSGKNYYPYVRECPEAWQKVLPQPER